MIKVNERRKKREGKYGNFHIKEICNLKYCELLATKQEKKNKCCLNDQFEIDLLKQTSRKKTRYENEYCQ